MIRNAGRRLIEALRKRYRDIARALGHILHASAAGISHEDKRDSFVEIKLLMPLYFNIYRDVETNNSIFEPGLVEESTPFVPKMIQNIFDVSKLLLIKFI